MVKMSVVQIVYVYMIIYMHIYKYSVYKNICTHIYK